jgi:hypothetical protein
MSARLSQRFYTCVGILLLLGMAACDSGVVAILPLPAAGGGQDAGDEERAGTGAETAAGSGGTRAGSGSGGPRVPPPPDGCDESTEQELEDEQALREAFIDTYNSGKYCPNLSNAERRTLVPERDLDWRARATGCFAFDSSGGWFYASPRTPVMAWVLISTPSLEDAKKALLGGEHTELCEEAERTPMRFVGVAHTGEVWAVVVAPGPPDDMQKP